MKEAEKRVSRRSQMSREGNLDKSPVSQWKNTMGRFEYILEVELVGLKS